ncbi:hypothetical protein [Candidatus Palauibacter sp.]|uniref:hypothetical protein n=1 Tax=Candidatus Palauibacter sp. TaxID=3101350 RepID=UPI003B01461F
MADQDSSVQVEQLVNYVRARQYALEEEGEREATEEELTKWYRFASAMRKKLDGQLSPNDYKEVRNFVMDIRAIMEHQGMDIPGE